MGTRGGGHGGTGVDGAHRAPAAQQVDAQLHVRGRGRAHLRHGGDVEAARLLDGQRAGEDVTGSAARNTSAAFLPHRPPGRAHGPGGTRRTRGAARPCGARGALGPGRTGGAGRPLRAGGPGGPHGPCRALITPRSARQLALAEVDGQQRVVAHLRGCHRACADLCGAHRVTGQGHRCVAGTGDGDRQCDDGERGGRVRPAVVGRGCHGTGGAPWNLPANRISRPMRAGRGPRRCAARARRTSGERGI